MARMYAETSHFRAPFKNWPSLSAAEEAPLDATTAMIETDKDGIRFFKPVVADAIMAMLPTLSIIHLDNDNVKVDTRLPTDVREDAASWVKRHVASGMTIIAGTTAGAHLFAAPISGIERYLSAVKTRQDEIDKASSPLGAVLVRGSLSASLLGKLGPIGIAAVALLAVGGVALMLKKKRRSATPNRRRRSRGRRRR